jgi:hypothetical protein
LAANSNSARSRVPARSRGQRTAIRISVANGGAVRGVAVRRAARRSPPQDLLWARQTALRYLCAIAPHGAQRAGAQRLRLGSKAATVGASPPAGPGGRAPILECPPIRRVEPLCLGTGVSVVPRCDRRRRMGLAKLTRFRSIGRVETGIGLTAGRRCVGQRRSLRRHRGCLRSPVRLPLQVTDPTAIRDDKPGEHDSCRDSNRFIRLWQALLRRGKLTWTLPELPRAWECFAPPSSGVCRPSDERRSVPRPGRTQANRTVGAALGTDFSKRPR